MEINEDFLLRIKSRNCLTQKVQKIELKCFFLGRQYTTKHICGIAQLPSVVEAGTTYVLSTAVQTSGRLDHIGFYVNLSPLYTLDYFWWRSTILPTNQLKTHSAD